MTWPSYLIQANICLILFYCFYAALLRNETFFVLNRTYLVCSGLASFVIPLMQSDLIRALFVNEKVYQAASSLNTIYIKAAIERPHEQETLSWLLIIYLAGACFFLGRLIVRMGLVFFRKRATVSQPYSFFRRINIPEEQSGRDSILRHETVHATQLHSADVIFFEVISALNWFNPVVYFYKRAIKYIHEFIADESAARDTGDRSEYSLLLFSNAFGISPSPLSNRFFNESLLKRRITMLHKNKSNRAALVKYGLSAPLFLLMVIFSSASVAKNEKIIINMSKDLSRLSSDGTTADDMPGTAVQFVTSVKSSVKGVPVNQLYSSVTKNMVYPASALRNKVQGDVVALFSISSSGEAGDVRIAKGLGYGFDEEVIRALKNVKQLDPALAGNYSVRIRFRLHGLEYRGEEKSPDIPLGYKELSSVTILGYQTEERNAQQNGPSNNDGSVHDFASVDEMPDFPGGIREFYQYISKNYHYPPEARKNNVKGRLILTFIIEKDGSLSSIKALRDLGMGTGDEAVRMLENSPKWKPGRQTGIPVRVQYTLPIMLNLEGDTPGGNKHDVKQEPAKSGSSTGSIGPIPPDADPIKDNSLYIVNGKETPYNEVRKTISPQSIKNIEVIKGKSATDKYGEKGKNGVVLIYLKDS